MEYKRIIIFPEYKLYFNLPEPYNTSTIGEYKELLRFITETYIKEAYNVFKEAPKIEMLDELLLRIRKRLSTTISLAYKCCSTSSVYLEIDHLDLSRSLMKNFKEFRDYREGTLKIIGEMLDEINLNK
ncbi:hypothetical protein [Flavobacterium sp. ZS1P14]|uniref:hypothetical protein n=1 Tax=Flavobacterium sp. ZS1P14 TaxID=3401729 RepID=UPI003AAC6D94